MGVNIDTAKKAEKIAKKISIKRHGSPAFKELYLSEAYDQLFDLEAKNLGLIPGKEEGK